MKTILIRTQQEFDALPDSFSEFTEIQIRSKELIVIKKAYNNSSVVAYDNSSVEAYKNSSVVAYDNSSVAACNNSSVVAYDNSSVVTYDNSSVVAYNNSSIRAYDNSSVVVFLLATVVIYSSYVKIKQARDNAHIIYKVDGAERPEIIDPTVKITNHEDIITPTFEQWLERGYMVADGINKKLVSQKQIKDVTIFEVTDFFGKEKSFVVKKGDKFAHGETIEKAKEDLRFKISDRDTSRFES